MITQEALKNLLHYDLCTGIFVWKVNKAKNVKAGKIAGRTSNKGYRQIKINDKLYSAHRLAWLYVYGKEPIGVIDHINMNKIDNRIENLRDVSIGCNTHNRKNPMPNNLSGYLGVSISTYKGNTKYVASIKFKDKQHYLGRFNTAIEAHEAYIKAKRLMHEGCTI